MSRSGKTGLWPMFFSCTLLVILVPLSAPVQADDAVDAREIIRKMDLLMRGDTSFGVYKMTINDPDWVRQLTLNAWENRVEKKTFIEILDPPKEEGIVTLKIDYEMWNYLPRVERIIKVPPSMMLQPWMGSDFTNDDLVKASSIVIDYTHEILAEEQHAGYDAYKVELIPKADAPVVWGRILVWVRQADSMPLRQEFYADDGELIRVLRFDKIQTVRGRDVPTYWEMTPVGESGRQTIMEVVDLEIDAEIDDSIFSLRNIKRRK